MVIMAGNLILVVSCLLLGVSDGHRAKKVRECRFYFSLYARKTVFVVVDQARGLQCFLNVKVTLS